MKKSTVLLSCIPMLAGFLHATPDRSVRISEQFFGSGESGYAVLRTEDDNCGSYYRSEISTWLDEYPAADPSRKLARRTLLLKVSSNRNPDDHRAPPVMQVLEEESTMTIAGLLKKYPVRALEPWTREQVSKMQLHPKAGIHFRNRVFIIDGAVIDKEVFEGRHSDSVWRMDGVSHDAKMVYVQVSAGNDEGPQTRLIGVPLKVSKIVKDQLEMEAFYLVSDRFDSKEAAVSRALGLGKLAREKNLFAFQPEVWSTRLPTDRMAYLVTTANSEQLIRSGSVKSVEEGLGIDFEPVSSERFEERIALDEESGDR